MSEFIVAYAPSHCRIASVTIDQTIKTDYQYAINRKKGSYGDVVAWNNQFWCSVKAKNSGEAFMAFCKKFGIEVKT